MCVLEHRLDFLFCVLRVWAQVQGTAGVCCFQRRVVRMRIFARFRCPRKAIYGVISERLQRLCEHKIATLLLNLRRKIVKKKVCGKTCTISKVVR